MELLKPEILKYLQEFDGLDDYQHNNYLKTVKDNAIRMTLEIRSANVCKDEQRARQLFNLPFNDNMYSVHEKFMTTLIFKFPQSEVKKWCKKSLLTNQRICLLLEMDSVPYTPDINLTAALDHAMLYRDRYYDLINRKQFIAVKNKVLRSIGPMEYMFKEENIKFLEKRSIVDIFEKAMGEKCAARQIEQVSKVFDREAYKQINFTKTGKAKVDDVNKLLTPEKYARDGDIFKILDRGGVDELFKFAKKTGLIDNSNNLLKPYSKEADKQISKIFEEMIIELYDYTALKLMLVQLCAFSKLGYEMIPSELFISQVITIGIHTFNLEQSDVIDSIRDLLWINDHCNLPYTVYGGNIGIDKKMAKAFPDSLYLTDKNQILNNPMGVIQLTTQPGNYYEFIKEDFPWFF